MLRLRRGIDSSAGDRVAEEEVVAAAARQADARGDHRRRYWRAVVDDPQWAGNEIRAITSAVDSETLRKPRRPRQKIAITHRTAPHATADDPRSYIDLERVEQEKKNECLGRYERYLRRLGILGDELDKTIKDEAAAVMRAGIAAAEAEPDADIGLIFEHAFANPPASFQAELAELRRILGGDVG